MRLNLDVLDNPIVDKALDVLGVHSWVNFERSVCHGDLTLQNILVKDGQLYFIDFLDSFYDCWLLDVATLLQDVQTMWSYRDWNLKLIIKRYLVLMKELPEMFRLRKHT